MRRRQTYIALHCDDLRTMPHDVRFDRSSKLFHNILRWERRVMTDVRSHERHEEDFNEVRTCSTTGIE